MKLEGEWVILGDEIYLWQATWEHFWSAKFAPLKIYLTHC